MTRLTVELSPEAAVRAAAERLAGAIRDALARRGRADVALAGGETPRPAYELLAGLIADWDDVHIWFGDDRAVGPEHPDSNMLLVAQTLLAHAPVAARNVHRMRGELGADAAADAYEEELAVLVPEGGSQPVLDLALLGLGEDGHTASLFPGNPALQAPPERSCVGVHGAPKPPPDRITLTVAALLAARARLFLVVGEGKAQAVARMLAGPGPATPASLVTGSGTEVLTDPAAASAHRA